MGHYFLDTKYHTRGSHPQNFKWKTCYLPPSPAYVPGWWLGGGCVRFAGASSIMVHGFQGYKYYAARSWKNLRLIYILEHNSNIQHSPVVFHILKNTIWLWRRDGCWRKKWKSPWRKRKKKKMALNTGFNALKSTCLGLTAFKRNFRVGGGMIYWLKCTLYTPDILWRLNCIQLKSWGHLNSYSNTNM